MSQEKSVEKKANKDNYVSKSCQVGDRHEEMKQEGKDGKNCFQECAEVATFP